MQDTVVLIPAYDPADRLVELLRELSSRGLAALIVNDGSPQESAPVFAAASEYARVIGYEKNEGKGHALKYGIAYIQEHLPEVGYIVTADADGQHAPGDIARVADAVRERGGIVIGARTLNGKIPLRSRVGNDMSRFVYAVANDSFLGDNQSGLRGFGVCEAEWLCDVPGSRYEYEMNVLMRAAKKNVRVTELPITTIYENGNESSHFRPVPDTLQIHRAMYSASWASVAAAAAKYVLAVLLSSLLANNIWCLEISLGLAGAAGIAVSLLLNRTVYGIPRRELPPVWPKLWRMLLRLCVQFGLCEALCRAGGLPIAAGLPIAGAAVTVCGYYLSKLTCACRRKRAETV